jgi:hypothetical protein
MTKYVRIADIDLCWDDTDPKANLGTLLEELAKAAPSSFVKIFKYVGSGGGWPQGEIVVRMDEVRAVFEFFGYDEFAQDYEMEYLVPFEA